MNKNIDLIETFQKSNRSITRKFSSLQIEKQERDKREAFYHENITLILENPISSWTVPRFRITPDFVQSLVDKKLQIEGGILRYLREIDGEGLIITPNDNRFNLLLKSTPAKYRIEVELPSRTRDVLLTSCYFGDMEIIIRGIPKQSQSCLYLVQKEDIRRWLIENILSEDPHIVAAEKEIEEVSKSRKNILKKLQKLPNERVYNERGFPLKGADAAARLERWSMELEIEERELRQEYDRRSLDLQMIRKQKQKGIEFQLTADEHKSSWALSFYGEQKSFNEDVVLTKINWKKCFMYTWEEALKDQTHRNIIHKDDYLVDTTNVSVQRVEHGKGLLCNTKTNFCSGCELFSLKDYYDFYFGLFVKGIRHGSGIVMNDSHIFIGDFDSDYYTRGIKLYNDGDIVTNSFTSEKVLSDRLNPYEQGTENGCGTIRFTDGAIFEGFMKNGEITVKGIYISAIGERFEGEFLQGILVEGLIRDSVGDEHRGCFNEFGLLYGKGTCHSKAKRTIYKGQFDNGEMLHGEEVFLNKRNEVLCKYSGFFSVGDRFGTGSFTFRDRDSVYQKKKNDLRIECLWIAGSPSSGGIITDLRNDFRMPTTNHKSSDYRWLNRFRSVEKYKTKKAQKENAQKLIDDLFKRNVIVNTKKNIFNIKRTKIEALMSSNEENAVDETLCPPRTIRTPPRNVEEAEVSPGLRSIEYREDINIIIVPEETMPNSMNKVWKELQDLENSWGTCIPN
jgi:hypothetical protein